MGIEARFEAIKASLPVYDGAMDYHTLESRLMGTLGSSIWQYLEPDGFVLQDVNGVGVDALEAGIAHSSDELKAAQSWFFQEEESDANLAEDTNEVLMLNGVQIFRKGNQTPSSQLIFRKLGIDTMINEKEHSNTISLIQACLSYVFANHQVSDTVTTLLRSGRFRFCHLHDETHVCRCWKRRRTTALHHSQIYGRDRH